MFHLISIKTAKFFFFDVGIVSYLLGYKSIIPGTHEYGRFFEHFILQECWAYRHYSRKDFPVSYGRTASGSEVDLILGEAEVAIEIKSSKNAGSIRTKGLHLFGEENKTKKKIIVSRDPIPKKLDSGILVLPWKYFCNQLWDGDII